MRMVNIVAYMWLHKPDCPMNDEQWPRMIFDCSVSASSDVNFVVIDIIV